MVDVQLENGYTKIANEILEVMAQIKLSPTQYRILFVVWRYTYGFHRKDHLMSLTFLSNATGCDKRHVQRELKELVSKGIVFQNSDGGKTRTLGFNKNFHSDFEISAQTDNDETTIGRMDNGSLDNSTIGRMDNNPIVQTTVGAIGRMDNQERNNKNNNKKKSKENYMVPYQKIISYLNLRAGTNYRHTAKATQSLINGRWSEGHELGDFKLVIDKKCDEWLDTDQGKYLRPETLFSAKHFESYLNQPSRINKSQQSIPLCYSSLMKLRERDDQDVINIGPSD